METTVESGTTTQRREYVAKLISRLSELIAEEIGDALGVASWQLTWDYVENESTKLNKLAASYISKGEGREKLDAAAKEVLVAWRTAVQHYRKANAEAKEAGSVAAVRPSSHSGE